jgi:hypothetical protein
MGRKRTGSGYIMIRVPGHPLETACGLVGEHRVVLYDAIGPGPHPCHWCGQPVDWVSDGVGVPRGSLVTDHVDNNVRNNDPSNLVPSCGPCNGVRSRKILEGEVVFVRSNGTSVRGVEKTCLVCSKVFTVAVSASAKGQGVYCSRPCSNAGRTLDVCRRGHPRTPDNLVGRGQCKLCMRIISAEHNDKRREARRAARAAEKEGSS